MDSNEKATVRFETMPGKQGQMDRGFFEDHLGVRGRDVEETVLFPHDSEIFADVIHRICNGYEHKHVDTVPSGFVSVLWGIPGGDRKSTRLNSSH